MSTEFYFAPRRVYTKNFLFTPTKDGIVLIKKIYENNDLGIYCVAKGPWKQDIALVWTDEATISTV